MLLLRFLQVPVKVWFLPAAATIIPKACVFSQTETEELFLPFTDYRILFLRIKLLYNDVNDTGPG